MLGYHHFWLFVSGAAIIALGVYYSRLSVVQERERAYVGLIGLPAAAGIYVAAALTMRSVFGSTLYHVRHLVGLAAGFLTAYLFSHYESLVVDTQPWSLAGLAVFATLSALYGMSAMHGVIKVGSVRLV